MKQRDMAMIWAHPSFGAFYYDIESCANAPLDLHSVSLTSEPHKLCDSHRKVWREHIYIERCRLCTPEKVEHQ